MSDLEDVVRFTFWHGHLQLTAYNVVISGMAHRDWKASSSEMSTFHSRVPSLGLMEKPMEPEFRMPTRANESQQEAT